MPIFPMSWKSAAVARAPSCLAGQPELAPDCEGDAADALGVTGRVRIARLDRRIERLDGLEQRRLELARRFREVVRARREVLVLHAKSCGRAADEEGENEPEDAEHDPDREPDRAPRVVDDLGDDGVVECDLRRSDDAIRATSAAAPTP